MQLSSQHSSTPQSPPGVMTTSALASQMAQAQLSLLPQLPMTTVLQCMTRRQLLPHVLQRLLPSVPPTPAWMPHHHHHHLQQRRWSR